MSIRLTPAGRLRWESSGDEAGPPGPPPGPSVGAPVGSPSLQSAFETDPLAEHLAAIFGRPGLVLRGATGVRQRRVLVDRFQSDDGPPFFILSLKAGGTGLTPTAASHVIHLDRWWNPAVENQATDRAFRIGQRRNVLVHKFMTTGTVEERIDEMIAEKQKLADDILAGDGEVSLTELSDDALLDLVRLDVTRAAL